MDGSTNLDPTSKGGVELTDKIPKEILSRAKSNQIDVSVRIGRSGVSESFLSELSEQLDKRGLVKVKANRGISPDGSVRDRIFYEISVETNSKLVFQRGNVAVFWSGK